MRNRLVGSLGSIAIAIIVIPLLSGGPRAQSSAPAAGARTGASYVHPRTAWGDPDLQALWTSDGVMGVPVELPKKTLTAEDIARRQRDAELREQAADRDSNVVWDEIKTALRDAPPAALVVDPPDGRIPLTREGQQRLDDWGPTHYGLGISSWADLDLWDRCITKGFPTVMIPMGYANAFRILQTRDSVAILFEIIHDVRIIPIDKRPHVGSSIRQYWGDSRGHWEGNTLVVEVTNFSDKTSGTQQPAGAYRGGGREQRIVERFTRLDGDVLEYRATIEDPKLFTRPFTLRIPMARNDTYKMYEYACHEGNYGLPNILSAAKAAGYPEPRTSTGKR